MMTLLNRSNPANSDGRIAVESMGITLSERSSTATMTPRDMTGIEQGRWLRDETNPGSGLVWRVKQIKYAYANDTPTISLEHIINTLRDYVMAGEVTPQVITGTPGATTCTALEAVNFILQHQSDWTLQNFSYASVSNPYDLTGMNLYDALETITNSLDDAWWSYDTTQYPFKLSIMQTDRTTIKTRLYANRNIRTLTRTIDRSGMFTWFWPIGKDNLMPSSPNPDGTPSGYTNNYVTLHDDIYGKIEKVATDTSIEQPAELVRWANEQLKLHAQPTVTIDVEGIELRDATGEDLDGFWLGRVAYIPLKEFNTAFSGLIVGLNYPDKIGQKEVCKITISNERKDVTKIIAQTVKEVSRSNRSVARNSSKKNSMVLHSAVLTQATEENNWQYTLHLYNLDGSESDWTKTGQITFSRAVTGIEGTWSGNHYYVTVSPTGQTGGDTYIYNSAPVWTNITDGKKGTISVYYYDSDSERVNILTPEIEMTLTGAWSGSSYTATMKHGNNNLYSISTNTYVSSPTWSDITDGKKATVSFYYVNANAEHVEILPANISVTLTGSWTNNSYTAVMKSGNIGLKSIVTSTFVSTPTWSSITDGKKANIDFYYVNDNSERVPILSAVLNMKLIGAWSSNSFTATMQNGSTDIYSVTTQTFVSTPTWTDITDGKKATISFYYLNSSSQRVEILPAVLNMKLVGSWSSNSFTAKMQYGNTDLYSVVTNTFVSTPTWSTIVDGKQATISFYYINSNNERVEILPAVFNIKLFGTWSSNSFTATMKYGSTDLYSVVTNTFVSTPTWSDITDGKKATISFYYINGNNQHVEILPAVMNMKLTGTWSSNSFTATMYHGSNSIYSITTNTFVSSPTWTNITDGKKATISFYYINASSQHVEILPAVLNMKLIGSWSGNSFTAKMQHGSTDIYSISTNTFVSTPTWGTGADVNKATVSFYYINENNQRVEILPAVINASSRYEAGVTAGQDSIVFMTCDDNANRIVNNYNVKMYDASGNLIKTLYADDPSQGSGHTSKGFFFPLSDNYPISSNGTHTPQAPYLGFRSVVVSGVKSNRIKFTRGSAVDPGGNVYNWSAQIGTNVTGSATEYYFYY